LIVAVREHLQKLAPLDVGHRREQEVAEHQDADLRDASELLRVRPLRPRDDQAIEEPRRADAERAGPFIPGLGTRSE
jgi:hypothetical protein